MLEQSGLKGMALNPTMINAARNPPIQATPKSSSVVRIPEASFSGVLPLRRKVQSKSMVRSDAYCALSTGSTLKLRVSPYAVSLPSQRS